MTKSGFVIANLFRKRTRTILTLLSVITAFLLFGLLRSVNTIFSAGADFVGATRLIVQARVSFTSPLPISMLPKLEAVPGVARVGYSQWFGGVWQENTPLIMFSIDPLRHHDIYPEYVMPEGEWQAFADTRTGMIAGKTVAAMFENSPDETKTQTEKDFNISFVKQIGDIGLIVRWILFAVFFTLLLVVGNTMAQSVRERIPELAVLKTLGFSDRSVLGFVLAEALALCLAGGLVGLALASLAGAMVEKGTGGQFQLHLDGSVWLLGVLAIVLMSVAVGLLPGLRAGRLRIGDALAGH